MEVIVGGEIEVIHSERGVAVASEAAKARPSPVLGPCDQTFFHGIEMHIAQGYLELFDGALYFVEIPRLPQWPAGPMPSVDPPHCGHLERIHQAWQVIVRAGDQKGMPMVWHQDKSRHEKLSASANLIDSSRKRIEIARLKGSPVPGDIAGYEEDPSRGLKAPKPRHRVDCSATLL
jgi:hypothetical protein